jgi:hypothetical protein
MVMLKGYKCVYMPISLLFCYNTTILKVTATQSLLKIKMLLDTMNALAILVHVEMKGSFHQFAGHRTDPGDLEAELNMADQVLVSLPPPFLGGGGQHFTL